MIPAEVIAQMAALGLTPSQAHAVAGMLRSVEEATERDVDARLVALEAADEARRAKLREGNRERQRRHRDKAVTRDKRYITRDERDPLLPLERSPPTPPSKDNPQSPWIVSDETIVPEKSGTRDRKQNVELFQTVVGMWNDMAVGLRLVAVRDITPTRQAAILARSTDLVKTYDFPDALAGWRKLMGLVRGSPFLRGERNGFRCDFDFVTRASSFTKIMEGKYEAQAARR